MSDPMFPIPGAYRSGRKEPTGKTKWRKHTGKPMTCEVCIIDMRHGVREFTLQFAKAVAETDTGKWFVCYRHKAQVTGGERGLPDRT